MENDKINVKDLDLQIRIRSSKMSSQDLAKITSLVLETLAKCCALNLVEQNTIVNQTVDKKLITITSILQSRE